MTATLPEVTPTPTGSGRTPVAVTRIVASAIAVVVVVLGGYVVLHGHGDKVPYRDAASSGRLTLCDRDGHRITSGSTSARPAAWRVVGASTPPAAYAAAGRTATLYAYQPRAGVDPSEWSGEPLTAPSRFQTTHAIAQATDQDLALADFLTAYPATDDGFVQLRLYLGAPEQPALTQRYDSLDLRVEKGSWRAVAPGRASCSGTATSIETLTGVVSP